MKATCSKRYLKYLTLLLPFFLAACSVLPSVAPTAVITGAPEGEIEVGTTIILNGKDSSGDSAIESYEWSLEAPNGSRVVREGFDDTFSFTPDVAGIYTATLIVTDDSGETGEAVATITAVDTDSPPDREPTARIGVEPGTEVDVGSQVTLDGSASTDDGSIVSYKWSLEAPAGSSVRTQGQSETFRFTPDVAGTYTATLTVTDNSGQEDRAEVTINVNEAPAGAPVATISGEPANAVEVGTEVTLSGSQSENAASYRWTLTTPGGNTLTDTGETFSFTPDAEGSYTVELVVTNDDGLESSDEVVIRAQEPAAPGQPQAVITGAPNSPVQTGENVTLDGSGSTGGDSDVVMYAWEVEAPNGSDEDGLTGNGSNFSFTPDVAGTYTVTLTVTDEDGKSDSTAVQIEAESPSPENRAPVADAGSDRSTTVNQSVTLSGSASSDPDGDPLTYNWTLQAPSGSSLGGRTGSTASFTFTPDVAGTYTATLEVSDGELTDTDTVVVTVTEDSGSGGLEGYYPVPSIDPKGVEWVDGTLFIIDSEISENRDIFSEVGANFFQVSLDGNSLIDKWDLTSEALDPGADPPENQNSEPAGLTYCEGYFFISNDNTDNIVRYRLDGGNISFTGSC